MVTYDGRGFPFGNNEFDICWCNAVLEHVGNRKRQIEFLREIRRVLEATLVITPKKLFPIAPHARVPMLHYLPKKYCDKILVKLGGNGRLIHICISVVSQRYLNKFNCLPGSGPDS